MVRSAAPADVAAVPGAELAEVREQSATCRRCPLWRTGTQTVFGEGPADARVMLVGEQPGDREDREGRPFVGPAGRLLDDALARAGIDRGSIYVTNAVKHFKWKERGARRIHQKPDRREVAACAYWLERELELVRPRALVLLGATAAQSLLGAEFRVSRERGKRIESGLAEFVTATIHPSAILRIRGHDERERELENLAGDLASAREFLAHAARGTPNR